MNTIIKARVPNSLANLYHRAKSWSLDPEQLTDLIYTYIQAGFLGSMFSRILSPFNAANGPGTLFSPAALPK